MISCIQCGSENTYYSKKQKMYVCEDCGKTFRDEEAFVPQKVFLSYGHDENEELVRLIYDKLKERGHDPWIDRSEIKAGADWREAISRGILSSSNFLAFISKHSVRVPGVCLDEISIGVGNWNCRMQSILLEKGVAVPNSISNVQWLDFSDWKIYRKVKPPAVWQKWFDEKMAELFRVIEDQHAAKISGNITELEQKLHPLSMALKLRLILRDEIVGRMWLVNRIAKWFHDPHSRSGLVMYGRPGTGKSVMSAYLCNFMSQCVATFFFEWNNSMTKTPRKFLCSLMFQLACSLEDYRASLLAWLKTRSAEMIATDELLEEGLLGLLNGLIDGKREKKLVVLDAVDETLSENGEFLDILTRLIRRVPHWLKFFVTSRPEEPIVGIFQCFDCLDLDTFTRESADDLREYIGRGIGESDDARLVMEKCSGSFVYARELVRLWAQGLPLAKMNSFPPGVGGVYYANFERLCGGSEEYCEHYRPVLEILLAAREQLSKDELGNILGDRCGNLEDVLRQLRSYVVEVRHGNRISLQIFHKTFREWLLSETAGKYRVDISRANSTIGRYILAEAQKEQCLTPYASRYATEHISGREWEELPVVMQERLCVKLLEADQVHGNLELEGRHLTLLEETAGRGHAYYMNALEYFKKTSGKRVEELAEEALAHLRMGVFGEEKSFELACQISFAYYYMGNAQKAHALISGERTRHDSTFWNDKRHEAWYWHVVAVTAHDLDHNHEVVCAAEKDIEIYRMEKSHYNQYISMVNLFDGFMALGDLKAAERVAGKAFECSSQRYYVNVDDILRICHGNLLQTEGRVMESLAEYEEGLRLAKDIQKWDYVYGAIWRELAMARYGDVHSLNALEDFRRQAEQLGYRYLISLADCFFVVAAHLLGLRLEERMSRCLAEVREIGLPGHLLQTEICCQLADISGGCERVLACLKECEGVKGEALLVEEYFTTFRTRLTETERQAFKEWISRYAEPIRKKRSEWTETLCEGLQIGPKLVLHACNGCPAACCYDGVYLEEGEAAAIHEFVEDHAECFVDLPRPYIVPGDWPGMEGCPKTQRILIKGPIEGYPPHFTPTRCVFCAETGECRLQRVASDLQLHPWKVKPVACWLFPLRGGHGESLSPPSVHPEDDPDKNEGYPGYASFLPCTKEDETNGVVWQKKYRHEIEYFAYLKRKGRSLENEKTEALASARDALETYGRCAERNPKQLEDVLKDARALVEQLEEHA